MIELINKDFFEVDFSLYKVKFNLCLLDIPYGISYKEWDWKASEFEKLLRKTMDKIMPLMSDTGTIWYHIGISNLEVSLRVLREYGYVHLENFVTWGRQKGRGSKHHLKSMTEFIIHFTVNKTEYTFNEQPVLREVICPYVKDGRPRGWWVNEKGQRVRWTGLGNIWLYSSPQWNGILDKQIHPAQKPFLMYERLIKLSSNEKDTILDPFAGSFTSAVVSKFLSRNYIGIEKDVKIFEKGIHNFNNRYSLIVEEYNRFKEVALQE